MGKTGALRTLVDHLGGVLKAAARLGVTRRTVLRWLNNETVPSAEDQFRMNEIARRARLVEPYVKGRLRA